MRYVNATSHSNFSGYELQLWREFGAPRHQRRHGSLRRGSVPPWACGEKEGRKERRMEESKEEGKKRKRQQQHLSK
ncbi:hypothetical protein E2C01_084671 [Portunus trituberculatus]|uniref:Uncharacterized protein n=1 Tax=Portunus trituberculatus TaxID=210409 RepID=A0A5B7J5F9_PORTR|nr:hypothetical protein [Portunus trituberculatus]